jgi:hypothetical protein
MVFIFYRREVISLIKFTEVNFAAGLALHKRRVLVASVS